MTYLLDTNTCIRYLNGRAPNVLQRLQALPPAEIRVCHRQSRNVLRRDEEC